MARVAISPRALADLDAIVDYIAYDRPSAAARWTSSMHQRFMLLAAHPKLGQAFSIEGQSIRRFCRDRYVIYYCETTDGIVVLRVMHGAQESPESMT